eukprot:CAMPEP_0171359700 /NCGR_PEP_ID=MMETSP0879-20121228/768_1 /TAXON_ID=67004 /ORGANISM="Thalassiosira weissflogii, Strain CCMP1336" /LENGTH=337 /DNA_ID=CAMNT_0011865897 /DNA_START=504 /DNA_END=1514 /DNA_ORIENTATION=+
MAVITATSTATPTNGTTATRTPRPQTPLAPPTHAPQPPLIPPFPRRMSNVVIIALFQMQIDFLDDEFSLLVLLTGFIGLDVGPTDAVIAAFAEDVRDGVEAGDEWAVFGGTGANVYALVEEVGSSMTPMKSLGHDIIMTRQMSPTLPTSINLRPFQIDHGIVLHLGLFAQGLVILVVLVLQDVLSSPSGITGVDCCGAAAAAIATTRETRILAGAAAAAAAEAAAVGMGEIVAFGVFGWGDERYGWGLGSPGAVGRIVEGASGGGWGGGCPHGCGGVARVWGCHDDRGFDGSIFMVFVGVGFGVVRGWQSEKESVLPKHHKNRAIKATIIMAAPNPR